MPYIFITLFLAGGVLAAAVVGKQKVPQLQSLPVPNVHLPSVDLTKKPATPDPSASPAGAGSVAGAMTKVREIGKKFVEVGGQGAKSAANVLTATPTSEQDVVDVSKTVSQIATEVEKVPSNVLGDAKIEYCKRVLDEAQKAGKL